MSIEPPADFSESKLSWTAAAMASCTMNIFAERRCQEQDRSLADRLQPASTAQLAGPPDPNEYDQRGQEIGLKKSGESTFGTPK